ncbi:TPA: Tn3 family transposase [Legionella pneumophila]
MAISDHLSILSQEEISLLYDVPKIDEEDRQLLFEITPEDETYLNQQTIVNNKINYLLQVGYFRATRNFYKFTFQQVQDDTLYIINQHFPETNFPKKDIDINKHYAAQKMIFGIYKYKRSDAEFITNLNRYAKRLTTRDLQPKFVFDELLEFCEQNKIIRPKYSTLQGIVSKAISREENRLTLKLERLLNKDEKTDLDSLLAKEDLFHNLTLLKKDPKSFNTKEMQKELSKQRKIIALFNKAKMVIPLLNISRQNIQYYTGLAEFYDINILQKINRKKARLYLICFVWQRFVKLNDHLTSFFIHKMGTYEDSAKTQAQAGVLEAKLGIDPARKTASKILKIIANHDIVPDNIRPNCYEIIEQKNFSLFAEKLANPSIDERDYTWAYYDNEFGAIKTNLRSIFTALDFNSEQHADLGNAIAFMKQLINSKDKVEDTTALGVPLAFVPSGMTKFLIYKKPVRSSGKGLKKIKFVDIKRYEVMLYQQITKELNSGSLFISDTVNYRRLEDELISKDSWLKDKTKILDNLSDCLILKPIAELLKTMEKEIDGLYKRVNHRIVSKQNKNIKVDEDKLTWRLPYKKKEDLANNPFYKKLETVSLASGIEFTAQATGFFDSFSHILNKGTKKLVKPEHAKAYLIAQGASIGKKRLAESSDVSIHDLNNVEGTFIRLDSLVDAGDQIINHIAKLPIFEYYNLSDYGIHASLDGQKLETKYQTIMARYSTKYFGYGKGVVSYSLIANHLPVNTKVIGANEHESHHVLDIVYNNTSDLKITAVSGDMHSINRVNFALMYLFGYDFMPRFTKINRKADKNLVAFKKPCEYSKFLIKPSKKISKQLIIDEWDNILRIIASIAMKETSQSTVIRKLSSYTQTNSTLKALIEFDKIIMSIYMLKYIDDVEMRRCVHRALNRGEAFHQLRAAILKISGKQLLGKTDKMLEINNQCNKILACCMIYYNTALLSSLLDQAKQRGDEVLCNEIKRLSPVAWQHFNMLGTFTFCKSENIINIHEVAKLLLDDEIINGSSISLAI